MFSNISVPPILEGEKQNFQVGFGIFQHIITFSNLNFDIPKMSKPIYDLRENRPTGAAYILLEGAIRRCLLLSLRGSRGHCHFSWIHLLSKFNENWRREQINCDRYGFSVNSGLRLSSNINHLPTFSMQMVYVSRETHTIYMLKVGKWLMSLISYEKCKPFVGIWNQMVYVTPMKWETLNICL